MGDSKYSKNGVISYIQIKIGMHFLFLNFLQAPSKYIVLRQSLFSKLFKNVCWVEMEMIFDSIEAFFETHSSATWR